MTVEAGITLHELRQRSWPSAAWRWRTRATSTSQTLAGAISTATHGTGARFRNLSAQVAGMRLVTGGGEVVELAGDSDDLRAARVGLGALGVISAVTLRCVPLFTVRRVDEPRPLGETLDAPRRARGRRTTTSSSSPSPTRTWRSCALSERGSSSPSRWTRSCSSCRSVVLENGVLGAGVRVGRVASTG